MNGVRAEHRERRARQAGVLLELRAIRESEEGCTVGMFLKERGEAVEEAQTAQGKSTWSDGSAWQRISRQRAQSR